MKILFIGDIVARPGRAAVKEILPSLIKEQNIDFTIANAENLAHGRGATRGTLEEMMQVGVDFFTSGDHILWHKGFEDEMDSLPIIRPANFNDSWAGVGHKLVDAGKLGNILVMNLIGRVFTNQLLDDPFTAADKILEEYKNEEIAFSVLDFHAEATSEKYALGLYLDGRIGAVVGTHTHAPTCDHMVLPEKTLYISDIGMTGVIDSVLGVEKDIIINRFLTGKQEKFVWENTGRKAFRGVILDTDQNSIERFDEVLD